MTTNKPEVKRYDCTSSNLAYCYGCYTMSEDEYGDYVEWEDYEALQAAARELADWCCNEVGAAAALTPGLEKVMALTGVEYDNQ